MKTKDEIYEQWSSRLADRHHISKRVIRHIRSSYKDKFDGLPYLEAKKALKKEVAAKLLVIKDRVYLEQARYARLVLTEPVSLKRTAFIKEKLTKELTDVMGLIDKCAYYGSIHRFLHRITEEQFNEIVGSIEDFG